jgi:hypothetical protein
VLLEAEQLRLPLQSLDQQSLVGILRKHQRKGIGAQPFSEAL